MPTTCLTNTQTFLFSDHANMQARGIQSFSQKATNIIQILFRDGSRVICLKRTVSGIQKCLTYCVIVIVLT
jgi:hypothetical protein